MQITGKVITYLKKKFIEEFESFIENEKKYNLYFN